MSVNERFVRWQSMTINQLGLTTNLILTINIAVIGFFANIKISNPGLLSCGIKFGLGLLSLSFICGILINLTRLTDYRLTAQITLPKNILIRKKLKKITNLLGIATWCLFYCQLIIFAIGLTTTITFFIF